MSGASGTQAFTLSYDDTLPMLPSYSDPTFALNTIVAVYYPLLNPDGSQKNDYGIASSQTINLRNVDSSSAASPFLGNVVNIRTDMQYLYVQGWACLTNDNAAISVQLQTSAGTPVSAGYIYQYPWMFPHSGPIDSSDQRATASQAARFWFPASRLRFSRRQIRFSRDLKPTLCSLNRAIF